MNKVIIVFRHLKEDGCETVMIEHDYNIVIAC